MSEQSKENADRRDAQAAATAVREVYYTIDFTIYVLLCLGEEESSMFLSWLTFTTIFV